MPLFLEYVEMRRSKSLGAPDLGVGHQQERVLADLLACEADSLPSLHARQQAPPVRIPPPDVKSIGAQRTTLERRVPGNSRLICACKGLLVHRG